MGLLDMLGKFVDDLYSDLTGRPIVKPEQERREYARKEKALRKITGRKEGTTLKRKRTQPRTEAQRKKHREYMQKWRRSHPAATS